MYACTKETRRCGRARREEEKRRRRQVPSASDRRRKLTGLSVDRRYIFMINICLTIIQRITVTSRNYVRRTLREADEYERAIGADCIAARK